MVGWHSLRLFQTTLVILNIELLLNLEFTFSITSSGMDRITLWSSMIQIIKPILMISVTAQPPLVMIYPIPLKWWNFY